MNTTYYGEIVAEIAINLSPIINCANDNKLPKTDLSAKEMIRDICADAARIFYNLEDLSGEHFIDWTKALCHYCKALHSFILDGRMPAMADMISMVANSMDATRADRVEQAKALL